MKFSAIELRRSIRREWFLGVSLVTTLAFVLYGKTLLGSLDTPLWLGVIFIWLFAVILGAALAVARHADRVAESSASLTALWS